ncbi:WbqC family protein [Fulvivirga lutimaris]|uniref:WbqC family protein n=1 Tax=Fulvivirga lutimaris TaxID=1819566 RepID=UPI0012BBD9A1|nr:WbqC family protein [Fulvivirga lutimaris]MTI40014.1 hypothetical protein [Fulvivirga lutimaris]
MPETVLVEPQYLPPIEFFCAILEARDIHIEAEEHYTKQTYRNRCYIRGANKVLPLSIPVINGNRKIFMKDIKVDHDQKWANEHWRSIQSAYGKAPFYEFFSDYFEREFQKRHKFLIDLNEQMLTICLKLLKLQKSVERTKSYHKQPEGGILDLRGIISPKEDYTKRQIYQPAEYIQVFGKDFAANLSIIDLLMNEGPNAITIVTKSLIKE